MKQFTHKIKGTTTKKKTEINFLSLFCLSYFEKDDHLNRKTRSRIFYYFVFSSPGSNLVQAFSERNPSPVISCYSDFPGYPEKDFFRQIARQPQDTLFGFLISTHFWLVRRHRLIVATRLQSEVAGEPVVRVRIRRG